MRLNFRSCEGGQCPRNAVKASHEHGGHHGHHGHHGHQHQEELFVGRAMHEGSLVPGKINPSHSSLYISYGGQEVAKKHYEVLVQDGKSNNLHWVEARGGQLPHAAIKTGHERNGDPLFVARGQVAGGHLAVGKLNPKMGFAHLPYGGKEYEERRYEVLCFKAVVDLDD